jgi:alpha-beta hydrolase superfamily lysophospholipase
VARLLGLVGAVLLLSGCGDGDGGRVRVDLPPSSQAVAPPAQPANGPGGSQRRHAGTRRTEVGGVSGTVAIFEPAEPAPAQAPVVVFTQGVGPDDYQGWIEHLVGRGSIVVFQNLPFQGVSVDERRGGAAAGLRAALRELARPGHVRPRPDSLVVVGHSIGAVMAAQLAADATRQRLPPPRAVFALQPPEEDAPSMRPLRRIAASTLMLVLASDLDDRVGEAGAETLWAAIGHLPPANRDLVRVRSDQRGPAALRADHRFPLSSAANPPDALDWFASWKLLDGLQGCATTRRDCEFALGGTGPQRFMGGGATVVRCRRWRSADGPEPRQPPPQELPSGLRRPRLSQVGIVGAGGEAVVASGPCDVGGGR